MLTTLVGKAEAVQDALQVILMETLSIHDVTKKTVESFYHGLMVGLLVGMRENFIIKSNRESGLGRYDIAIIPKDPVKNPGIIIEVKNGESTEIALNQIKAKAYAVELVQHGCSEIRAYGMSFQGKEVFVEGGNRVL